MRVNGGVWHTGPGSIPAAANLAFKKGLNTMTFKDFKIKNKGGYYCYAAEDIPGFYKKGNSIYGNCDDMEVVDYLYQPLNGIYTVYLKGAEQN